LKNIGDAAPHGDIQPTARTISRIDGWLALAVGGLSLALYGRTLAPGLLPGDSGELQTLSALLGNTHPTGYPIYLLVGKLFTWLPVGDMAYRVNLLSAVMAALAVAGYTWPGGCWLGIACLPWSGQSPWPYRPPSGRRRSSRGVYTGGCLPGSGAGLPAGVDTYGNPRYLFLAGALGGLSLGVHMTVALLALAVGVFLLLSCGALGARARRSGGRRSLARWPGQG